MTPAEMKAAIQRAKEAGYADDDIMAYVASEMPDSVQSARQAGYSDAQILGYLSGGSAAPQLAESINAPIDDRTGAPLDVRFAVGSAADLQGKADRLRAYYGPENVGIRDGRLFFKDPKTGRNTYVNPSGMDVGDIAGGAREIASTIAGIPAAMAAAPAGGGLLSIPVAAAAGSAAGAAAGQGVDAIAAKMARSRAEKLGNPVPVKQSPGEALKEAAIETGLGTAGGMLFGGLGRGGQHLMNPMDPAVVAAYRRLGMPIPSVSAGSGRPGAALYEEALSGALGGKNNIMRSRIAGGMWLQDALDRTAGKLAHGSPVPPTAYELGAAAQRGAAAGQSDFKAANTTFYNSINGNYGQSPATLDATRGAIDEMTAQLSPVAAASARARMESVLAQELADEADGALNAATVAAARTRLGDQLAAPPTAGTLTPAQGQMRRMYGTLADDYYNALPPPVAQSMRQHKALEAAYHAHADNLERSLLGRGSAPADAQKVGERLLRKDLAPETVQAMRGVMPADDADAISAGILKAAGRPLSSAGMPEGLADAAHVSKMLDVSGGRGGYAPATQQALWGGIPQELADLRTVSGAMADAARMGNTSKTAQTNAMLGMLSDAGHAVSDGGFWSGLAEHPLRTAALPASALGIPWALSKLHTAQPVINYLAKPQGTASKLLFRQVFPAAGRGAGLLQRFQEAFE